MMATMIMSKRRDGQAAPTAAGLSFIGLAVIVLIIFTAVTWEILGAVQAAQARSRRLLDTWLSTKADAFVLAANRRILDPSILLAKLKECDRLLLPEAGERNLDETRLLAGHRLSELQPSWEELRAAVIEATEPSFATSTDESRLLLGLSARFESNLLSRLSFLEELVAGQDRALVTLLLAIAAAVLALIATGAWLSVNAIKERDDRRRLEELMRATYEAQEAERRRLALDLHDSLAQDLAASLMAARRLPEAPGGSRALVLGLLQTSIDSLRRIAWEMRPPELERRGFRGAALELIDAFAQREPFLVEVEAREEDRPCPGPRAALQLYRILQEALVNVRRHSGARRIRIAMGGRNGSYRLEIEDDGRGFVPGAGAAGPGGPSHLGLEGMRERARLAGGDIEIQSSPGKGTRILVEVPIEH